MSLSKLPRCLPGVLRRSAAVFRALQPIRRLSDVTLSPAADQPPIQCRTVRTVGDVLSDAIPIQWPALSQGTPSPSLTPDSDPPERDIESEIENMVEPPQLQVPEPIPIAPDVASFLKLIGRSMSKHAKLFPSWEFFWTCNGRRMQKLGIITASDRKYIQWWKEEYRCQRYGVGGDFKYIKNGFAHLRTLTIMGFSSEGSPKRLHKVCNIPDGLDPQDIPYEDVVMPRGYKAKPSKTIMGPYTQPSRGKGRAKVLIAEGMWEVKEGRKIDGGERRRDQVRFERGVAERRAMRETQGF